MSDRTSLREPTWISGGVWRVVAPNVLLCVAVLAPFLAIAGAEQAIAPAIHHGHTSSLMGRHMFAKAALIETPTFAKATAGKRNSRY